MMIHSRQSESSLVRASNSSSVLLVSPNVPLRNEIAKALRGLRWTVTEAVSGSQAWFCQEERPSGAVLLDEELPDLSPRELAHQLLQHFPMVDILSIQGVPYEGSVRSLRRNELLLALRSAETDTGTLGLRPEAVSNAATPVDRGSAAVKDCHSRVEIAYALPDLLGSSAAMQELAHLVRLAAPHTVTVLIEGETGTGKEVVARAVHRLSSRAAKPFMTLNCAAIPEHLLEAELFGHTRGAFTGAVSSRTGRIEAAHGGTLFLDEIGEMPLALQAKMLRFLESGEIQRIGDNETFRVDVRIVAATHQPLELHAGDGRFRLDLYHRLAMFPVSVPPLRDRMEDLPMLVQHTLERLGEGMPQRRLDGAAMVKLAAYDWPGNVRELLHVLQRAVILSSESATIGAEHVRLRSQPRYQ